MNKVFLPVAGLAVAAVLAGSYVAYPYFAVNRISDAVRTGDAGKLDVYVDWPAVREGLKTDLNALLTGAVMQSADNYPGHVLRQIVLETLGPKVVDNVAEAYATPAGFAELIRSGGVVDVKAAAMRTAVGIGDAPYAPAAPGTTEADAPAPAPGDAQPVAIKSARFVGVDKMEVAFGDPSHSEKPPVKGIMTLDGGRWKVTRLLLPVDEMLDAPQTAVRP